MCGGGATVLTPLCADSANPGSTKTRNCTSPVTEACKHHTMRWSHAHPTWTRGGRGRLEQEQQTQPASRTFYSLPFFGRWLRRHFRDETPSFLLQQVMPWHSIRCSRSYMRKLPAVTDEAGELAALAVAKIPEDEDLLNVATWEVALLRVWLS